MRKTQVAYKIYFYTFRPRDAYIVVMFVVNLIELLLLVFLL